MTCQKVVADTWQHEYPLDDFPDLLETKKVSVNMSDVILGYRNIRLLFLNLLFNVGLAPFTHSCIVAHIIFLAVSSPMHHLSTKFLGLAPFQALLDVRPWILWWGVLDYNASASTLVSDITDGTDQLFLACKDLVILIRLLFDLPSVVHH